jgi:hypothetical protein
MAAVIDGNLMPGFNEIRRHGRSHLPETQKSNFHCHPPAAANFIRNRERGGSFLAAY